MKPPKRIIVGDSVYEAISVNVPRFSQCFMQMLRDWLQQRNTQIYVEQNSNDPARIREKFLNDLVPDYAESALDIEDVQGLLAEIYPDLY